MLGHNVRATSEFYTCTAKVPGKCPFVRLLSRALQALTGCYLSVIFSVVDFGNILAIQ